MTQGTIKTAPEKVSLPARMWFYMSAHTLSSQALQVFAAHPDSSIGYHASAILERRKPARERR